MRNSKKIFVPRSTTSYGFVGVWQNGSVGWCMPEHASGERKYPDKVSQRAKDNGSDGTRMFLCKITVEPILAKNGRPITRIINQVKCPKKP